MADDQFDVFAPTPAPLPPLAASRTIGTLDLARYRQKIARLAERRLFISTSSWKYSGWCGSIYDEPRYHTRVKFSETKLERECLTEYAETFRSVCVDAGYYRFPNDYAPGTIAAILLLCEERELKYILTL